MIISLPYSPVHSLEWLEKFFSKNYYKKPYDRFMWWRSYTPKSKPLHPRMPFIDRILNGDFDMAPYRFEAEIVEHRLNETYKEYGYNDPGRWNQECAVDKARRKRLMEDYDKEESRRLEELRKLFVQTFKMTKDDYDREVLATKGNLVDFYYEMEEKYGTYWQPMKF